VVAVSAQYPGQPAGHAIVDFFGRKVNLQPDGQERLPAAHLAEAEVDTGEKVPVFREKIRLCQLKHFASSREP
jgi:hypothetical protein